jgi:hypothetical protein
MRRLSCTLLSCAAVGLLASPARAQANYDGVELGGRTAMMGGAGVARGSDGATAFINPAGLARIPGESFSFQTVAVSAGIRYLPDLLDPSGTLGLGQSAMPSYSLRILPNTFCLFLDGPPREKSSPRSRHKYGVCAADTESDALLLTQNVAGALGNNSTGVSNQTGLKWARSTLALSWALQFGMKTSIGVTARVENSRFEDFSGVASYQITGGLADQNTLTQNRAAQSWDAGVVVGVSHQFSKTGTIGASLSSPSQHFYGIYRATEAFSAGESGTQTLVQDLGDFQYNQPTNFRLGIAFAWPKFNFEVDGSLYLPTSRLALAKFDRTYLATQGQSVLAHEAFRGQLKESGNTVVNFMAGMEAFVAPDFSLVAGLQSNFSALGQLDLGTASNTLFRQRKSGAHASIGVVSYGAAGSLLLGLRGYYLGGEFLVGDPASGGPGFTSVSQSEIGLSVVVSGQISFEAVRDTAIRAAAPLTKLPKAFSEEEEERDQ